MKQGSDPAIELPDLPLLTDTVEENGVDIPVLTEVLAEAVPALVAQTTTPQTDDKYEQLAARIAPQLEALARAVENTKNVREYLLIMKRAEAVFPRGYTSSRKTRACSAIRWLSRESC